MQPAIIPTTYALSPGEARHKISYMNLKASIFSDSRDSLKSIKIIGRKKKSKSNSLGR
jgi:hypothetical protein